MEENEVLMALAALAQPHRLKLFRALVVVGPRGLTPGVMAEGTGLLPGTLSFHLKELTRAGLISSSRVGRNRVYRANFEHMNRVLAYLGDNCCGGEDCLPALAPGFDE